MSFGYSSEKGLHLVTTVPIEPYYTTGEGEVSAAELNFQLHGRCSCWELLGLVSALKCQYSEVSDRLCQYHREYYKKRTTERTLHLCECRKPARSDLFCWGCGYCHLCGADLCTTSTTRFHRCSCLLCLNRCCGSFGTEASHIKETRNRPNSATGFRRGLAAKEAPLQYRSQAFRRSPRHRRRAALLH